MTMLASALLSALAATAQPPVPAEPVRVRAQTQVFVQIIQAAEVKGGQSDTPHQRSFRLDELGRKQLLLQFE
jgi:hypothetical protein